MVTTIVPKYPGIEASLMVSLGMIKMPIFARYP